MKIINIEEIPNSHLNDELNIINSNNDNDNENENENEINLNVDDYDLNVDNINQHEEDNINTDDEEDNINTDEEEDNINTIIMNYDGYIFDNFEEECQNNLCKGKINKKNLDKFPRGLFIGGEVALCFICYLSGYRPCMYTHLIMHSDDMDCINNLYYYKISK
jgi:hypothetical protein